MKIQMHFSISFHFKKIIGTQYVIYIIKKKNELLKELQNLNQKIIMNFSLIIFVFYFQMIVS
jgi:hypothetical protein